MTDDGYGFTVRIDKEDLDNGFCTEAEWAAQVHRRIDIKCTLSPTDPRYTRAELLGIYRWAAGVLARIGLRLHGRIEIRQRYRDTPHQCNHDPEGVTCGLFCDEGIEDPRACLTYRSHRLRDGTKSEPSLLAYPPWLMLHVPTTDAPRWVEHFQGVIADTLSKDALPLAEPEGHAGFMLTDDQAQRERTE